MPQDCAATNDPICSDLIKEDPTFMDLVVQFVNGLPDRLKRMQEAMDQGDFDALRVAAHQLKGSGGGYGYPILTEHGAALEKLAKAQVGPECLSAIDDLKTICRRIVPGSAS